MKKTDNQNDILLSLSYEFVRVRGKGDMLEIIQNKLKTHMQFADSFILRYNKNTRSCRPFIYYSETARSEDPEYKASLDLEYPVADDSVEQINFPQVYDVAALLPLGIAKIDFMHRCGIKEFAVVKLIEANELKGLFILLSEKSNSFKKADLDLLHRLSYQISMATANIIANEEIAQREAEKAMLLTLCNDIAKIRNKNELRIITDEKIKTLLDVSNISFCYVSPDGKTFGSFILDPKSPSTKHPKYGDITAAMHPVNDGIVNKVLASEDPLVYDMESYIKTNTKVPGYFRMIYDVGMRQMIFSRLKNGEDIIGYLAITKKVKTHVEKNQLNLIKAIASQLSVALANIKANEQIEDQVKEINNFKNQLEKENLYLQEEINSGFSGGEIIGESSEMKKVFHMVNQVAPSDSTVLLLGETGTGKELIARAIHNASPRMSKLMVKVNCATLPANLIESELFGHERGSFTGAVEQRIGKFELANNGTLFLDEIGELPLELQVKLLRVLQEKEIERIGGKATINVDVRIIAATNRDLEKMMEEGTFRRDLFYRLNIFPINLPPLRNRREDIPSLAMHFIERFSKKMRKQITGLSHNVLNQLMQYSWPGNIRELEHLIERSVLLSHTDTIKEILLPVQKNTMTDASDAEEFSVKTIDENEREYILKVIKYVNGKIAGAGGAAQLLGVPPSTLTSKMKRLGIRKEHVS
ncbi:sigma-54-dependent Fis family transcriptional regulator [Flavobacterium sp. 3-210]